MNISLKKIKNENFKYISFDFRKEWIKLVYPYSRYFLTMITTIPWGAYTYDGPAFVDSYDENNNNVFRLPQSSTNIVTKNIKIRGLNYFLFGGSVAEVYNYIYEKESNIHLHDYVDPTGDFDVKFGYTDFELYEGEVGSKTFITDDHLFAYDAAGNLSPFVEHMTRWIFEQFVETVRGIGEAYSLTHLTSFTAKSVADVPQNPVVQNTMGMNNSDPLMLHAQIGDLHVIRKTETDIIKIQLNFPFETQNENSVMKQNIYADHLIEFVLAINSDQDEGVGNLSTEFQFNVNTIHNLNIQTPLAFINDQIKGYSDRLHILNYNKEEYIINRHKFINHLQRVLYMIQMALFLSKKDIKYEKMLINILTDIKNKFKNFQDQNQKIIVNKNRKIEIQNIVEPLEKYFKEKDNLIKKKIFLQQKKYKLRELQKILENKKLQSFFADVSNKLFTPEQLEELENEIKTKSIKDIVTKENNLLNTLLEDEKILNAIYDENSEGGYRKRKTRKQKRSKKQTRKYK